MPVIPAYESYPLHFKDLHKAPKVKQTTKLRMLLLGEDPPF